MAKKGITKASIGRKNRAAESCRYAEKQCAIKNCDELMKIDIEKLSEKELIELNHRIVERLKFLESMRAHSEMMEFSIGEKVCFEAPGRGTQTGILSKYNKKTVTVITEAGERWNISPHLLDKVREEKTIQPEAAKVIGFKGGGGKSA